MKEAFGYKPLVAQWKSLLSSLPAVNSNFILPINIQGLSFLNRQKQTHHRGLSAPIVIKPDTSFNAGLNDSDPCIGCKDYPSFIVTEICDPIMGGETAVIFPTNNVWEPVDQPSMKEDVLDVKSTQEW
mmetsp:Transcript_28671/g.5191  ORF Transcript_28671/g.5191 Transcript_28671/m.5191 type:complete len:128 (+) Transcript_28671:1085-1468(+)